MIALKVTVTDSGECCDDPVHASYQLRLLICRLKTAVIWVAVTVQPCPCEVIAICFTRVVRALVLASKENPEAAKNIDTGEHQDQNNSG